MFITRYDLFLKRKICILKHIETTILKFVSAFKLKIIEIYYRNSFPKITNFHKPVKIAY